MNDGDSNDIVSMWRHILSSSSTCSNSFHVICVCGLFMCLISSLFPKRQRDSCWFSIQPTQQRPERHTSGLIITEWIPNQLLVTSFYVFPRVSACPRVWLEGCVCLSFLSASKPKASDPKPPGRPMTKLTLPAQVL